MLAALLTDSSRARGPVARSAGCEHFARPGAASEGGTLPLHLAVESDFRPTKKAHPAFFVQNLDAIVQHLERAGVAVVTDAPLEGYLRIYVFDPFGQPYRVS